jgi:hypothetical protein
VAHDEQVKLLDSGDEAVFDGDQRGFGAGMDIEAGV